MLGLLSFQLYQWNRAVIFRDDNWLGREAGFSIEEALQENGVHVAEVVVVYIDWWDVQEPIPAGELDFKLNSIKERSRGSEYPFTDSYLIKSLTAVLYQRNNTQMCF